jgi:Zn-finger nucleic acid-binding protein
MDCPKCVGKLQKKKTEGLDVDVCFVCEGIWFDAGELEDVLKADAKDFDYIDVGREEFDGREIAGLYKNIDLKPGKCPRCGDDTLLVKGEYPGKHKVNIDICPKGHGLWLDGGEVKALRNREKVEAREKMDLLRYAFSREGFRDFIRNRGKSK